MYYTSEARNLSGSMLSEDTISVFLQILFTDWEKICRAPGTYITTIMQIL